jgi:hypothetical protein
LAANGASDLIPDPDTVYRFERVVVPDSGGRTEQIVTVRQQPDPTDPMEVPYRPLFPFVEFTVSVRFRKWMHSMGEADTRGAQLNTSYDWGRPASDEEDSDHKLHRAQKARVLGTQLVDEIAADGMRESERTFLGERLATEALSHLPSEGAFVVKGDLAEWLAARVKALSGPATVEPVPFRWYRLDDLTLSTPVLVNTGAGLDGLVVPPPPAGPDDLPF